ncbi:glycosyltransferase [Spirosoma sordidisoli]|uniref:Glycosyltransferase family 1 protein n=1 Tax=Spirosoma sordidisoli TaxID=2502893 RepID=A0A4Q2UM00_9BACT|nr:glycosyltransferase [Spirosoma sordidisoli]RYC68535.1 glycosyltransferase family 1 protein [Spirosoma sordidisoli]
MKKPRVFLVSTAHPATDPRIVFKQCPTLADRYDVFCALPRADPTVCPNARFIRLPYFRRVIWRVLLTSPLVLWHGIRLRPALIHIYVPELLPVAFVCRLFGTRVIYEVQENLHRKLHIRTLNRGAVLELAFRWFDRLASRYLYLIFTEHGYLSTYTRLRKPHVVIYNYPLLSFLDPFRQPYRPDPHQPSFLLIGLLSPERAFDTLIEALKRVAIRYPRLEAHLFGKQASPSTYIEQFVSLSAIRSNVKLYGYTDQRQALLKAAGATAGLALLKPVGDYPESYPTKLFEYMALGLPVITSDFPLYREVVERHNCGLCVSAEEPAAIAGALLYLTEHPTLAKAMGERGRRAVEACYSWATESAKLFNFYELVLQKERS